MVEELESIETLKTDFISNVSHEMKTPIAIIKNYAQLLRTGQASEEQRKEYAKNIEQAAARLSSLIGNILKLNRLEHQGNGLGLALIKRVLELSDGEIQITSETGKGSAFVVTLPAAAEP